MNTQSDNPYQGPQAPLHARDPAQPNDLATRTARLGAAVIDSLISLVVMGPVMYLGGYWDVVRATRGHVPMATMLPWLVFGLVVFTLIQFKPLMVNGQTWGKKLCGIRIVDLQGQVPTLSTLLFKRVLPVQVAGVIPVLGSVLIAVDILMIFRDDHRCLHDMVAGTRVVSLR